MRKRRLGLLLLLLASGLIYTINALPASTITFPPQAGWPFGTSPSPGIDVNANMPSDRNATNFISDLKAIDNPQASPPQALINSHALRLYDNITFPDGSNVLSAIANYNTKNTDHILVMLDVPNNVIAQCPGDTSGACKAVTDYLDTIPPNAQPYIKVLSVGNEYIFQVCNNSNGNNQQPCSNKPVSGGNMENQWLNAMSATKTYITQQKGFSAVTLSTSFAHTVIGVSWPISSTAFQPNLTTEITTILNKLAALNSNNANPFFFVNLYPVIDAMYSTDHSVKPCWALGTCTVGIPDQSLLSAEIHGFQYALSDIKQTKFSVFIGETGWTTADTPCPPGGPLTYCPLGSVKNLMCYFTKSIKPLFKQVHGFYFELYDKNTSEAGAFDQHFGLYTTDNTVPGGASAKPKAQLKITDFTLPCG